MFSFYVSLSSVLCLSSAPFPSSPSIPSWQNKKKTKQHPASSPLHLITIHAHTTEITLTQTNPPLLLCILKKIKQTNTRSTSSFSSPSGHHMHQPQFYQHPGKLGPASRGVSERRHYGILHPVLHHRGQQGVQTHRRDPGGKLSVSAGRP